MSSKKDQIKRLVRSIDYVKKEYCISRALNGTTVTIFL